MAYCTCGPEIQRQFVESCFVCSSHCRLFCPVGSARIAVLRKNCVISTSRDVFCGIFGYTAYIYLQFLELAFLPPESQIIRIYARICSRVIIRLSANCCWTIFWKLKQSNCMKTLLCNLQQNASVALL